MKNSQRNDVEDFFTEVDVMPDFLEGVSGGDLTIIFKKDYFAEDSELGRKLLKNIMTVLTENTYRISLLIFIGSGVKLLSSDSYILDELIKLSENDIHSIICRDSIEHYSLEVDSNIKNASLQESKDVINEIMNSLRSFNIE